MSGDVVQGPAVLSSDAVAALDNASEAERLRAENDRLNSILNKEGVKLSKYRAIATQYKNDLRMWATAHGADYPGRRLGELDKEIGEIEGQ